MNRLFVLVFLTLAAGCGFLAETVSDNVSLDLDTDLIPEASIAEGNLAPLTVDFALDAATPSYTLAGLETANWLPMLAAERNRRLAGGACTLTDCGAGFDMAMTSFALTGDYVVNFDVRIFSRPREDDLPGLVFPLNPDEEPVAVDSCSFTLEPTVDDGDDYAAHLKKCLSDWLSTNGVPIELDMEVTSSQGGPRQPSDPYSTSGYWEMDANQRYSSGLSFKALKLDQDVVNNYTLVDCTDVKIRGAGYTDSTLAEIEGGAWIFNGLKGWVAEAQMKKTDLPAGHYFIRTAEDGGDLVASDERIEITFPAGPGYPGGESNFMTATLEAAATPGSWGAADWYVDGDFPRSGHIAVQLSGPCKFK